MRNPACTKCNTPEQVQAYDEMGIIAKFLHMKPRDIVITKRVSDYEFFCFKCKWSRPDPILEYDGTKLWYVSCGKCNERHISPEIDKCIHCDLEEL